MLFEALEMSGILFPMREPAPHEPQDFSIWAMTLENQAAAYRNWMVKEHGISQLEAHHQFGYPGKSPRLVQLHEGYGWEDIPHLLQRLPGFIDRKSARVTVSGLKPGCALHCDKHQVDYRGHDCPVCAANVVQRGRRAIFQTGKA